MDVQDAKAHATDTATVPACLLVVRVPDALGKEDKFYKFCVFSYWRQLVIYTLAKELYHDLEAANYEYERTKDLLAFIINNRAYPTGSHEFDIWDDRNRKSFVTYQKEKSKFEKKVIPEVTGVTGNFGWNLEFDTGKLEVWNA